MTLKDIVSIYIAPKPTTGSTIPRPSRPTRPKR